MKKSTSFSRRITTTELLAGNGECRVYSEEERKEFRKIRMIQLNLEKLLKMQKVSVAAYKDYSPVFKCATYKDYSPVSRKSNK